MGELEIKQICSAWIPVDVGNHILMHLAVPQQIS